VELVLGDDPLARQSKVEEMVSEALEARGRSKSGKPGTRKFKSPLK